MSLNETIRLQLDHRSIRSFTSESLTAEQVDTLISVAQHTSTSSFMQAYSIVGVTDQEKKDQLAEITTQPYVAEASHVFIMLVDHNRNRLIAEEHGVDPRTLRSLDRFMSGYSDAVLAAQNMMLAAESMDLGGVFLGSILNDALKVADLIKAPEHTFPVLGFAVGYPDQKPEMKPRLPKALVYSENEYSVPQRDLLTQLKEYDDTITQYYTARSENTRMDKWTDMTANYVKGQHPKRAKLLEQMRQKNLLEY